jgi:hypothetical protein
MEYGDTQKALGCGVPRPQHIFTAPREVPRACLGNGVDKPVNGLL